MWRNWNYSTCGVISNFAKWEMWRNLKCLHIWHVCDVENASTCVKFMLFCWKIGFVAIYALLLQVCFVAIYALLCGEKLTKNCICGEKITNMRYGWGEAASGPSLVLTNGNLFSFGSLGISIDLWGMGYHMFEIFPTLLTPEKLCLGILSMRYVETEENS